jgi:cytochrome c oxidase subunit 4
MAEVHKSHKKEYFIVFFILFILTVVEIYVPETNLTKAVKGALLTFLACVKAFFVAWFFMHLKEETKWLWFIALIPVSAGIYATVVCLENYLSLNKDQIMNDTGAITQQPSSSFTTAAPEPVSDGVPMFPTWGLVVFLVVFMLILKKFIYTKDPKRHNK